MPDVFLRTSVGMFPAREDAEDHDQAPGYVRLRDYRALAAENDRLRAERDAAWQAGAEAMRKEAARAAVVTPASRSDKAGLVWHDGFTSGCLHAADAIRALPIPDKEA